MKKTAFLILAILISIVFISCATTSRKFNEMRNICEKIEKSDKLTKEDYEKMTLRFSEIEKELEMCNLDDEDKKELAALKGRYYGAITARATKSMKNMFDEFGNVVKGFVEGINSLNK